MKYAVIVNDSNDKNHGNFHLNGPWKLVCKEPDSYTYFYNTREEALESLNDIQGEHPNAMYGVVEVSDEINEVSNFDSFASQKLALKSLKEYREKQRNIM